MSLLSAAIPWLVPRKTGLASARVDLFNNAICLVTPTAQSPVDAVCTVQNFWKALGGWPVRMTPEMHDDLVSRSSHLPHVVAAELANYVLSPAHPKEQALVCASGFRDTTRIAASSPEMWRDVVLANRKNLGRVLGVCLLKISRNSNSRSNARTFTPSKNFSPRPNSAAKNGAPTPPPCRRSKHRENQTEDVPARTY
jgi:hypothetical protein